MVGKAQKFAKQAAVLSAQAAAGRKPKDGPREPNGRPSREAQKVLEKEANEVNRLRAAALAGMGDPRWATQLGRLFLERKISSEQYAVGCKWGTLMEQWRAIHCGPRFNPKAGLSSLDRVNGGGAGPVDGADDRERAVMDDIDDAVGAFSRGAASAKLNAVRQCVEQDLAPVGYGGMLLLLDGLDRLADYWKAEK